MHIFEIYFLKKYYFLLLFFLLIFLYFFYKFRKKIPIYSSFSDLNKIFKFNNYWFYIKIFLIISIFTIFVLLLSDPNLKKINENLKKNGIDIVLAFDVSLSMEATDLAPNRLESAKKFLLKFLDYQKTNRVWLVLFSWKAFEASPLGYDYYSLQNYILNINTDFVNRNFSATAIWDAILLSKSIFNDKIREKVIILITDWDSNSWIDPNLAALRAKEEKIKIYTIWIWSKNETFANIKNGSFEQKFLISPLNEENLRKISEITNADFFRADENSSFENIISNLEKLEKNEINYKNSFFYKDLYDYFAFLISFLLFFLLCYFLFFDKKFYLK